jgi:hypothetical protein
MPSATEKPTDLKRSNKKISQRAGTLEKGSITRQVVTVTDRYCEFGSLRLFGGVVEASRCCADARKICDPVQIKDHKLNQATLAISKSGIFICLNATSCRNIPFQQDQVRYYIESGQRKSKVNAGVARAIQINDLDNRGG